MKLMPGVMVMVVKDMDHDCSCVATPQSRSLAVVRHEARDHDVDIYRYLGDNGDLVSAMTCLEHVVPLSRRGGA